MNIYDDTYIASSQSVFESLSYFEPVFISNTVLNLPVSGWIRSCMEVREQDVGFSIMTLSSRPLC